jgi:hypothetical protein
VVLLDVSVPGMVGFMFLEAARRTGDPVSETILMLTPGRQPGDTARCPGPRGNPLSDKAH